MLDSLHRLATIATRASTTVADVREACEVVRRALGAEDAYVVRGGDPHFIRLGCDCDPTTYEVKQKGYWLAWQALARNPDEEVGLFSIRDRLVVDASAAQPGVAATHLVTILPNDESSSELLLARGEWAGGLSAEQLTFAATLRPTLAQIVSNVVDSDRRARQREQLEALSRVSTAFNEATDTDHILTSIATALAKASGFDWVTIVVFNDACDDVAERTLNYRRHSDTGTADSFRAPATRSNGPEVAMGVELARRGSPILLPDVFDDHVFERENAELMRRDIIALRPRWKQGHVMSVGIFPVVFQRQALGYISFSNSTARAFEAAEVAFLSALVSQAATTIKGVRLYHDLRESREELRQSEERFRSLVQNGSDLITICDGDGTLRYATPAVERLMGYRPDEWIGRSLLEMVHPDDVGPAAASLEAVAAEPGVHPPATLRVRHADGSWRYVETTANNLLGVPAVRGIVHNSHDVTERYLAEAAMRQSEERFRSLVQHGSDLITVIDADTTIRYQSPSVQRVLGYAADDLISTRLTALLHPDDVGPTLAVLNDIVGKSGELVTVEARMRHLDAGWRDMEFIATDQRHNPAIAGFVLNIRDVTERKSLERQLRHQALHDPLTKLANRTRFADRLDHALIRAARTEHMVAVLFMDLDNFKGVNDSLGHAAGDLLLTSVAERVSQCLRPGDTVARLGGDEFAVLVEDVESADAAEAVTRRIFDALQPPFELEGKELLVRASIGIAIGGGAGQPADADSLLRDADVAMYVAKSRGKARYEVFEPSMQVSMMERLQLLADLQRAIDRHEFVLQYQPVILLKTGELFGVEALVRWHHPTRGVIQPSDFIPLAEESGAILPLGSWILGESCRQAKAWQDAFPLTQPWTMSVNVSVRQLQNASFVADVAQAIELTGLAPQRLILEITESVMMQDIDATMTRLGQLKALGVRLAIDDFGTGYSSLSYLRQFPFDLLKIDKSFIDDVGRTAGRELTSAIIELGKTLDLELVAEGIERDEQLSRLLALECELGQGFFFAPPMDAGAIEDLLSSLTAGGGAEEAA
ncbi:MAG: EAL domain-containing protein [Dehalococcoidia bacterium]|nr:EAL domain-containing protein [Dehalococcoidia bacterium]